MSTLCGSFDASKGELRLAQVYVDKKYFPDNHYNLVNIHPSGDGNGKSARPLMNYVQLFQNEPLIKVFTEDRADYIDALNRAGEDGDISIFRDFICNTPVRPFIL